MPGNLVLLGVGVLSYEYRWLPISPRPIAGNSCRRNRAGSQASPISSDSDRKKDIQALERVH